LILYFYWNHYFFIVSTTHFGFVIFFRLFIFKVQLHILFSYLFLFSCLFLPTVGQKDFILEILCFLSTIFTVIEYYFILNMNLQI
jgi:hypothetical protein